jgi:hypothetical protein
MLANVEILPLGEYYSDENIHQNAKAIAKVKLKKLEDLNQII